MSLREPPLPIPEPELREGQRFDPGPFTFGPDAFPEAIRDDLRELYGRLEAIYRSWLADPERAPDAVLDLVGPELVAGIHRTVDALQEATEAPDAALRELVHDLRGGGLTALVGIADLIEAGVLDDVEARNDHLQLAIWFARDHAKMMRMALPWLDPVQARADADERPHAVADLVRKWDGARYRVADASAVLRVHPRLSGALATRCVEAAALDRVGYNLLNNAVRFARGDEVDIHLDGLDDRLGRIAVVNAVDAEQGDWLRERLAGDPGALFATGVTRGGRGDGLTSVARIVSSVFGTSPAEAVATALVGTRVAGDRFVAWFHWPRGR